MNEDIDRQRLYSAPLLCDECTARRDYRRIDQRNGQMGGLETLRRYGTAHFRQLAHLRWERR